MLVDLPVVLLLDFPVADEDFDEPALALVPELLEEEPDLPEALRPEVEEDPEDMLLGFPVLPALPLWAPPDIIEAEEASMLLPG